MNYYSIHGTKNELRHEACNKYRYICILLSFENASLKNLEPLASFLLLMSPIISDFRLKIFVKMWLMPLILAFWDWGRMIQRSSPTWVINDLGRPCRKTKEKKITKQGCSSVPRACIQSSVPQESLKMGLNTIYNYFSHLYYSYTITQIK